MPAPSVDPRSSNFPFTLTRDRKFLVAELIYFISDSVVDNYSLYGSQTSDERGDDTNTHVEVCCDRFEYPKRLQVFRSVEVNARRDGLIL